MHATGEPSPPKAPMKALAACLAAATIMFGTTSPTIAANGATADLGFVDRWHSATYLPTDVDLQLYAGVAAKGLLAPGDQIEITIDRSGPDSRVRLEMLAQNSCAQEGSITRCVLTMDSWADSFSVVPYITAVAGTAPGPAGKLVARIRPLGSVSDPNLANNVMTTNVHVDNGQGADVDVSSPAVRGNVGEVVTVPVTVLNRGPNSQSWIKLGGGTTFSWEGMPIVGASGCGARNERSELWLGRHQGQGDPVFGRRQWIWPVGQRGRSR